MKYIPLIPFLLVSIQAAAAAPGPEGATAGARTAPRWTRGPSIEENFFPIAVWLQDPRNAARFKAAGINLYVGLWRGPTVDQLAALSGAGLHVICSQNQTALAQVDNPTIVGWMHGDEPDNAQEIPGVRGYGPPITPQKIRDDYEKIRATDPTRPVLLNLGQGVAWDNYIGRGIRRNHPEDYPGYVQGCDIASFDIYPAVHDNAEVAGRLEFVARGVERLGGWAGTNRLVWNCIECTHIGNPDAKATPEQVRAEVWMSLIHGSRGLIYFVHQFKPVFREAALLDDPETLSAVTAINRRIHTLAPVLNRPSLADGITVESATDGVSLAWMLKRRGDAAYLFVVNMRNLETRGGFHFRESVLPPGATHSAVVLDESREVALTQGGFTDDFKPYAVHLYEIRPAR